MNARQGSATRTKQPLLQRAGAALLAALLIACFQGAPLASAYAAESQTPLAPRASASKSSDASPASPDAKLAPISEDVVDDEEEEEEESAEEKEKREAAEGKRAAADSLYAQASAAQASYAAAQAKYDEASNALNTANEQLEAAKVEYEEKAAEVAEIQEDLSDYVVDMYKQGGATPYLDVMLGATNYREFLTSWNMTVAVGEYGQGLVAEKKQIVNEAEGKISSCEDQVKEAERAKALADSNRRQINATRLALVAQAAEANVEAAEIEGDEEALEEARSEAEQAREELDAAVREGLAGDSLLSGTGYFTHPCPNATVSSGFGYRSFDNAVHKGLDLAAAEGTPYYAADSGTVTAATNGGGDNGGAGNWIVIDHGNGMVTKYMHSLVTFVTPGQHVERGQNIGLVGNTGQSSGPHLHFQVEANGVAVNPVGYL